MFKTTKSRLLLSALSLLVCISMFVGSTFAWFTDSVSSVNNIIKSGNLDIEVEYTLDGSTWSALTTTDPIFPVDDLWEPGFTRVVALKVKNVGSLAAKLDVAANIVAETEGTNVYDETFKLSQYLKVYTTDTIAGVDFSNRASVAAMTPAAFGTSLFAADDTTVLLPNGEQIVVLGITMPTTVGNEANHKTGTAAPQITFGVTVNATQQMYENDSFGNDYDENATYPEAVAAADTAALKDVFATGGAVALSADVDMATSDVKNERLTVPEGKTVILDLAGNTLTSKDGGGKNSMAIYVSRGATLILNDSVGGGSIDASCYGIYVQPGAKFVMNGGTINVSGNGVYDIGVNVWNSEFVMNGGEINAKFAVWTTNYWKENGEPEAPICKVTIADGCTVNSTGYADVEYNDAPDTILDIPETLTIYPAGVSTAAEFKAAIAAGENVTLASDLSVNDSSIVIAEDTVINLNGKTLSGASTVAGTAALIKVNAGSTLTLTNGTVSFASTSPDTDWNPEGFPTYANNTISCSGKLVIDGATIINDTPGGGATYAIDCYPGADLVVKSGTIKATNNVAIRMFANSATIPTNVTIDGGNISGKRAIWIHLPGSNIASEKMVNLTINGGTFTANDTAAQPVIYSYSYGDSFAKTNITITGGTFNGDVCFGGGNAKTTEENVTITGGTFNGELGRYLAADGWEDIAKP